jgi:hypothetical protein
MRSNVGELLMRATARVLAATGGAGKSQTLLRLAHAIAIGAAVGRQTSRARRLSQKLSPDARLEPSGSA